MHPFKRTNTEIYAKTATPVTPDTIYWKKLQSSYLLKEFGGIDYIDFSPVEPHNFAVTCSVRVQIYNPVTKLVVKNLSKFQKCAFGGSFRKDGRLLVAGDEESCVRLFDVSSKNMLRLFKGHRAPVHRTFFTADGVHVASFSDDKTAKVWDIPTEKAIVTYAEHSDYLRAGCVSPIAANLLLAGGYDGIVKVFDSRTAASVFEVRHEAPVESIVMLPTGGIFITAGGTEVKVWDALAGGKQIAGISQHHKTVTCLRLASGGSRLLSAGLDRHVKVYDVATYQPVHDFVFSNAILSMGIAETDKTLAVGMVDGMVAVHRREEVDQEAQPAQRVRRRRYEVLERADEVVDEQKKPSEPMHDKWFRKYEYSKALDSALRPYVVTKKPHVTVAVIKELIRRKGLERALAGRSQTSLKKFVVFLKRYIGDCRFTPVLVDAANILLNVYEGSFHEFSIELTQSIIRLAERLAEEETIIENCLELQGALELLISAASVESPADEIDLSAASDNLHMSEEAKKNAVILVLE